MNLGQLIETLIAHDQSAIVPQGFATPHSYRGYYDCLAFEPAENVTVASMLAAARKAVGTTYTGWKGGEYRMGGGTEVYLATIGDCGDELTERLLGYMLMSASTSTSAALTLLTLPAEPSEGTCVEIVGGNNDGQMWQRVNTGLTPDAAVRWKLRRGVSGSDWARWSGLWLRLTEDDGDGQVGIRVIPTPFTLGKTVKSPDELDAGAVVGLIVVDRDGNVGAYVPTSDDQDPTWAIAGLDGAAQAADLSFPVTVRFVPQGGTQ